MPHREGFACAGPWVIEHVREVTHYPAEGSVANIQNEYSQLGCTFHLMAELRGLDVEVPLYAIGSLGEDENGHRILDDCHDLDIDTYQLCVKDEIATAHAEVVISQSNQTRTSFYCGNANDLLSLEHFDFRHCLASWFHLHDLGRLPALLQHDDEHGAAAGRVLHMAREAGLVASLYVDQLPNAFAKQTLPSILAFVDHLIASDNALSQLIGLPDAVLSREAAMASARQVIANSTLASVAIVCATAGGFVARTGEFQWQEFPSERQIHLAHITLCAKHIQEYYNNTAMTPND